MKRIAVIIAFLTLSSYANAINFGIHCDDVELLSEMGIEEFVNECYEKGYSTILINVMPWEYYFNSSTLASLGWEYGGDLLKPLLQKAHEKGMKVFADIQTLAWKVRENYENPGRRASKEDVANIVLELIEYGVDGISEEMFPAEWMSITYNICSMYNVTYIHKHIPYDVAWFNEESSDIFRAYSNCNILMTEDYHMNDDLARNGMAAGFCNSLNKKLWIKSCPEEWALGSIENMENVLIARGIEYNPEYIFAMIYNKKDFEDFEPGRIEKIIRNFSYAQKNKILNVVVYLTNSSEDMDAWQLFDISYAAIANAAGASGYKVYITNEPMENADAYFVYTRGKMNTTLRLTPSILALFNQSSKPVFMEISYDLPKGREWDFIREKFGIDREKEYWSVFGTVGVEAEYNGIKYQHLSNEWYLFNPIEMNDVSGEVLSHGRVGGKTYALVIKKDNFIFINGAGLDGEASFPISNILNNALQQPFNGLCSVAETSVFYAYENTILKIKFPYKVEKMEIFVRSIDGNIMRENQSYWGEFSYAMNAGDLLILRLIMEENVSVRITKPGNNLYINDREVMGTGKPIIIGRITIEINAANITYLQIYVDDEMKYEGTNTSWVFDETIFGWHEIKAVGYGKYKAAEDSIEVLIFNF